MRLILGWTLKGQKARHGRQRRKGGVETVKYTTDPVDVLSRSHAPRSTTLSSSTVPAPTGRRQAVVVSKCPKCLGHHSINFHVSEGRYNELIDILQLHCCKLTITLHAVGSPVHRLLKRTALRFCCCKATETSHFPRKFKRAAGI